MIAEELVKHAEGEALPEEGDLSGGELIAQGIATSIDALSVGFTIADLGWQAALFESVIIGAVTLFICLRS
jgi:putative Mn2+ efflux pump MntP